MKKILTLFLTASLVMFSASEGNARDRENIINHLDTDYSYSIAESLTKFKTNKDLGFRTAGSSAELAAGDMLYEEFKKLGLKNVRKDEFTVDAWEFKKAELTYTDEKNKKQKLVLNSYAADFVTKGTETYELVYLNKGTRDDYENINVKGKIVMLDINQRDDWWINYPAMQAKLKGAKAIIAVNNGGYAEISDNALNVQDMCGPEDTPALGMSKADGEKLKALLSKNKTLKIGLDVDSQVKRDQKAYNIVGEIPGKDPDSLIILSSHYDGYFEAFQDNATAVALTMGIAKGILDSGYKPEKTIIIIAHAAEEWGTADTRYDWSVGAYNQVFKLRPDWAGKSFAMLNFEQPGSEHVKTQEIRTVYEYKTFIESIADRIKPSVAGVYEGGIKVTTPPRTWADDFSYSIAGIPTIRNDYVGASFMKTTYHTNYDTKATYNEKAFNYNHQLYAQIVYELDQKAVLPMDFSTRFTEFKNTLDKDLLLETGNEGKKLLSNLDEILKMSESLTKQLSDINNKYEKAVKDNNSTEIKKYKTKAEIINKQLLALYKYCQDSFIRLTWEDDSIFPHEHAQNNINALSEAIALLEKGDAETAVNDQLSLVDNNWYALSFDKETYEYFTNQVLKQDKSRLNWGAGRIMGHEDLYDIIFSLQQKQKSGDKNTDNEINALKKILASQKELMKKTVITENKNLTEVKNSLSKIK
jgi:Iap family predicted aminopeptidase